MFGLGLDRSNTHKTLLSCIAVTKRFKSGKGSVLAVDGISFAVRNGEVIALVGESGSGKTTLAKIMAALIPPTSGDVYFESLPLSSMSRLDLMRFRKRVQFIPQFPDLALDPTWYLYDSIAEPLRIHGMVNSRAQELEIVRNNSSRFGLSIDQLRRKPRDLSGGEVQRAVIARALAINPDLVIADEPTSMLDPSTQAKIMRQLLDAHSERGFALLLVTHDLDLAKAVSERICVMLKGKIVEEGSTDEIFSNPMHPYTRSLMRGEIIMKEDDWQAACPYYGQCSDRLDRCTSSYPPELKICKERFVRCWRVA
jgi:peptide/nickel transport system ATP-binding protein